MYCAVEIMEISSKSSVFYRVNFTKYFSERISCFSTRWKLRKNRIEISEFLLPLKKRRKKIREIAFFTILNGSWFHEIFLSSKGNFCFSTPFWQKFRQSNGFSKEVIFESWFHEKISVISSMIFAKSFQTFRPVDLIHTTRNRRG